MVDLLLLHAGVAVGSGWQALVAYVNVGTYYLIGVPLGIILGWPLQFGVGVCSMYYVMML
jgi:hypothetical protein